MCAHSVEPSSGELYAFVSVLPRRAGDGRAAPGGETTSLAAETEVLTLSPGGEYIGDEVLDGPDVGCDGSATKSVRKS